MVVKYTLIVQHHKLRLKHDEESGGADFTGGFGNWHRATLLISDIYT